MRFRLAQIMLQLSPDLFIAKGALRATYHHPHDERKCIKINYHGNTGLSLKRQKREIKLYKKLAKKGCSFRNISQFLGYEETNLGVGYVYEKIIGPDKKTCSDISTVLQDCPESERKEFLAKIQDLGVFLLENKIFFHDGLWVGNVLCRKSQDDSYDLVIIDALGDTVLIPILNYIPACSKSRILRKWNKYMVHPLAKKFSWLDPDSLSIDKEG